MFFNLLQLAGWIGVGYNLNSHNWWALIACVFFSLIMGMASAMSAVGKAMLDGNSSKQ